MIIHTYEKGERGRACEEYIKSSTLGAYEVFILPIPTTRDGILIKDSDTPLEYITERAKAGVYVICYGLPRAVKEKMTLRGARVYDAGEDEEFLSGNAELTALATLGILLNTENRSPRELSFGIVGYGRIGKRLARLLLFLGARVRVYTSRDNTRLELCEYGVASSMSARDADISDIDILINTAPAVIFDTDSDELSRLRVIDLASGNNFPSLKTVESYPSIPAKMFPRTAGTLLGECAVCYFGNKK